jgi:hypothetical protein
MKFPASLILFALVCSGCVTFKEEEFATIRAHNVPPAIYRKLKERQVVTPSDVVELWRRGVPQPLIEKQIDKIGVDYALRKSDVAMLTQAGVPQGVIDALIAASDRFLQRYAPPHFFEAHDVDSDEYVVTPSVRSGTSVFYGTGSVQR